MRFSVERLPVAAKKLTREIIKSGFKADIEVRRVRIP